MSPVIISILAICQVSDDAEEVISSQAAPIQNTVEVTYEHPSVCFGHSLTPVHVLICNTVSLTPSTIITTVCGLCVFPF